MAHRGPIPGRISIHAPAWGATMIPRIISIDAKISIHAPAWGATCQAGAYPLRGMVFQSTHPHGVRRIRYLDRRPARRISNHAPAWGATLFNAAAALIVQFQSTHPHGVRLLYAKTSFAITKFQSTHPHGVRRVWHGKISFTV